MMAAGGERTSLIAFGTAFAVLGAVWLSSVLAVLPTTVITSSWDQRTQYRAVIPQSWAFFTRDPQTPSVVLYEADTGEFERADSLPQTRSPNAFGLSRSQRSQDTEKVFFVEAVTDWTDCGGMVPNDCLSAAMDGQAHTVRGVERAPNFCGQFVVAYRETTPYNYRNFSDLEYRLTQTAAISVECS